MQMQTRRFGRIDFDEDDLIRFPEGLLGLEECRRWILLSDHETVDCAWLQCLDRPEVALTVVSPKRYLPDYQFRLSRQQLCQWDDMAESLEVLLIVGQQSGDWTVNLKAPLLIHPTEGIGRQAILQEDLPIRYALKLTMLPKKRSA